MSFASQLYKIIFLLLIASVPLLTEAVEPGTDSLQQYAINKVIPGEYKKPILTALSYFPELKNVKIIFRIKKQFSCFITKPDFISIFKRKNHRTYLVTISDQTIDTLKPLMFQNLTFEQQVGVIGHELSHVVDFNSKNFFQTIELGIGHLSKKYIDRMEFNTDRICIMHGMGSYLLANSKHVREVMHVHNWRGSDFVLKGNSGGKYERYMNPETIEKYMASIPKQ